MATPNEIAREIAAALSKGRKPQLPAALRSKLFALPLGARRSAGFELGRISMALFAENAGGHRDVIVAIAELLRAIERGSSLAGDDVFERWA